MFVCTYICTGLKNTSDLHICYSGFGVSWILDNNVNRLLKGQFFYPLSCLLPFTHNLSFFGRLILSLSLSVHCVMDCCLLVPLERKTWVDVCASKHWVPQNAPLYWHKDSLKSQSKHSKSRLCSGVSLLQDSKSFISINAAILKIKVVLD